MNSKKNSNNYFGVKANKKEIANGKFVKCKTHEEKNGELVLVTAKFAAYKDFDDSLKHYAELLNNDYKPSKKAIKNRGKVKAWVRSLRKHGYASNSAYETMLLEMIDDTWKLK